MPPVCHPIKMFECGTRLSASSHAYTLALVGCRTKSHSKSFISCNASFWNLHSACFPCPSINLDLILRVKSIVFPEETNTKIEKKKLLTSYHYIENNGLLLTPDWPLESDHQSVHPISRVRSGCPMSQHGEQYPCSSEGSAKNGTTAKPAPKETK